MDTSKKRVATKDTNNGCGRPRKRRHCCPTPDLSLQRGKTSGHSAISSSDASMSPQQQHPNINSDFRREIVKRLNQMERVVSAMKCGIRRTSLRKPGRSSEAQIQLYRSHMHRAVRQNLVRSLLQLESEYLEMKRLETASTSANIHRLSLSNAVNAEKQQRGEQEKGNVTGSIGQGPVGRKQCLGCTQ